MLFRRIIKYFEDGNVCVTGLRGRGKDMLIANVVCRRKLPYVSNVEYDPENHIPFKPVDYDLSRNTYKDFINGTIKTYVYPHADGTDIYVSDAGVYFPAQYCNELNRDYPYMATFSALSRQVGACNFHVNVQNLNRVYDKLREMSDTYISAQWCVVLFGWVLQKVIIYDNYESCVKRVKPYAVKLPMFANREMQLQHDIDKQRYEQVNGEVRGAVLLYRNKSTYDTRIFKRMLEEGAE